MRRLLVICAALFAALTGLYAQSSFYGKMSPFIRRAASENNNTTTTKMAAGKQPHATRSICAFIRITDDADRIMSENGCRKLAQFNDIYIADIPLHRLKSLTSLDAVKRIEARPSCMSLMDTTAAIVNALPVYAGTNLPQAYTGRGVVVGVQDVGFDLTHPNFYDIPYGNYRIKRLWDQLSTDTVGSRMYVGADYTTQEELLRHRHSRDGLIQAHGTHTLGIAAGGGHNSPYRGIAYESDICLVSNAVTSDTVFIDDADTYKYTSATDALGFKYIFDYATETGQPCVISFSEGSHQDFYGDDQLLYETLQSMVGPGRIIVASAGNEGNLKTYFRKPRGIETTGTFISSNDKYAYLKIQADKPFQIRMKVYKDNIPHEEVLESAKIMEQADTELIDTLSFHGMDYIVDIAAYPSCYNKDLTAYEVYVEAPERLGYSCPFSFEILGSNADVEVYRGVGDFVTDGLNTYLSAGEHTHSIYSPGSAPAVICAGATAYRQSFYNADNKHIVFDCGRDGVIADYSSVGPTVDGRVKPEVVAPGTNVISSFNSFYMEANPNAGDFNWVTSYCDFNNRRYAWINNVGTSMSAPVVAGAVALWLEANPRLSPDDVRDIFSRTCKRHDAGLAYPNNYYGYGEIDIYKGLLDALGLSAIGEISDHHPQSVWMSVTKDKNLSFFFDGLPPASLTIKVFTTSGTLVQSCDFAHSSSNYTMPLTALPDGIYAVQLLSSSPAINGSWLVRLHQ